MMLHAHRNVFFDEAAGIEVWLVDRPALHAEDTATFEELQKVAWVVLNFSTSKPDEQINFFGSDGNAVSLRKELQGAIRIHPTKTETLVLERYVARAAAMWREVQGVDGAARSTPFDPEMFFQKS